MADPDKSRAAIEKADAYLQSVETTTGYDRTLVNTMNEPSSCSGAKNNVCFI